MKIKTIDLYENPFDLLEANEPDALEDLTEEEKNELRNACDFESIAHYVVNHDTVLAVDTITGDVLGEDALFVFVLESVMWAREQAYPCES